MRRRFPFIIQTLLLCGALIGPCSVQSVTDLERTLVSPPDDARPMMRWWWFGAAVAEPELSRELHVMRGAGLGGVEIQPVYPLALDDPAHGIRNLPYLSPDFLAAVRFANTTARALGLRVDITLGSGWPYGGPGTTLALSAGRLKLVALPSRQSFRHAAYSGGWGRPRCRLSSTGYTSALEGSRRDPHCARPRRHTRGR